MIYRCVEHYNNSNDNISNIDISSCESCDIGKEYENAECFICLDVNSCALFKLNELCIEYYKNCSCCGFVHRNCLNSWFVMSSNKCPICRNNMKKKIPVHIIIFEKSIHYIFICRNKCYLYCNIFLHNFYTLTHNIMYIFVYFIGILYVLKLIIILYILCFTILDDNNDKSIKSNQ